jgi:hypothetical protein
MLTALHHDYFAAFQEFHHRGARHADQGSAGAGAAQVNRAFKFPAIYQMDHVIAVDAQDARQKMHGERFTGRQVLADVHGLTL